MLIIRLGITQSKSVNIACKTKYLAGDKFAKKSRIIDTEYNISNIKIVIFFFTWYPSIFLP